LQGQLFDREACENAVTGRERCDSNLICTLLRVSTDSVCLSADRCEGNTTNIMLGWIAVVATEEHRYAIKIKR